MNPLPGFILLPQKFLKRNPEREIQREINSDHFTYNQRSQELMMHIMYMQEGKMEFIKEIDILREETGETD